MPDKANRNEAQTRLDLITPVLKEADWEVTDGSHIRVEVIAPGHLQGAGKRAKLKQSHPHQVFTSELTVRRRNLDHTLSEANR